MESSFDFGSEDSDSLLGDLSPSRFHAFEDLVAPLAVGTPGERELSSVPIAVLPGTTLSSRPSPLGMPVRWLEPEPVWACPESVGTET